MFTSRYTLNNKVVLLTTILCLAGCGNPKKNEIGKPSKHASGYTAPDAPVETETAIQEPSSEKQGEEEGKLTLDSWIAQLPPSDPRRIRFESRINNLWKARDKKIESHVVEAREDLATLQEKLSQSEDPEEIATLQSQIGSKHLAEKNLKLAVESYSAALVVFEELEQEENIAFVCLGIGTAYENWRNFAEAEQYFARAAHLMEKLLGPDHPEAVNARNLALKNKSINDKVQRILTGREEKATPQPSQ
jgi:tetratricopeptide (TPR) repeat protein